MGKSKTVFFCQECGGESVRWMGKCPHCGAWNSLVEEKIQEETPAAKPGRVTLASSKAQPITKIAAEQNHRWKLGLPELDQVLGGGLVPGSSVLLGGEPGIGKSTLLLQAAQAMSSQGKVLYISGEESAEQIRLRAERLHALSDQVYLLAQTDIDAALSEVESIRPSLLIIDSVQAVFSSQIQSAPGSVSQVRAVAATAIALARAYGCAVMLIGHVTKEGMLAGPRVLEHMVDTVLYFEGERYNAFRLLRAVKNRFGSTNEVGVFQMTESGLAPLLTPSAYFLSQREGGCPGSAVCCLMQGARPLLMEIQALTAQSSFGNPRRLAAGYDYNRLMIILAVLERKLGLSLGDKDVYVNVAGGMRVDDPAADLAVAAAIVSSALDRPIEDKVLLLGEIGLLGELRHVSQSSRRLKEAANFGFNIAVCPEQEEVPAGVRRLAARDVAQALTLLGLQ